MSIDVKHCSMVSDPSTFRHVGDFCLPVWTRTADVSLVLLPEWDVYVQSLAQRAADAYKARGFIDPHMFADDACPWYLSATDLRTLQ